MDFKHLSVLVTGSSGFIGSHVVRHLHEEGHRVTALDYLPPTDPLPEGVTFHQCDIRENRFPNKSFDAVVHLAALAGVRPSIDRQLDYEITNVLGTIRLLYFCRRMAIPSFVFASSSSVYGPDTPLPAREDHPANPCSPYALTKLHGEQWGRLYARQHGLRFLALRFFSVWDSCHDRNASAPTLPWRTWLRHLAADRVRSVSLHGFRTASAATSPMCPMWPGRWDWRCGGGEPGRSS